MLNTGFSEITQERLEYQGRDPWYCEIAVTGKCNFNCSYCNRFQSEINTDLLLAYFDTISSFRHIQLTGGEPTLSPDFFKIVSLCRRKTEKLGLSTNGTFGVDSYLRCEIDMFSISLDDYDLEVLVRRGYRSPEMVIETIRKLAKTHYVNVAIVIDSINFSRIESIVDYVLDLGVDDIKLSTSTHDELIPHLKKDYADYPILSYRVKRFNENKQMRGNPCKQCGLIRSDLTMVGNEHYPCLVYFREKGDAIGKISGSMMAERFSWYKSHDCSKDPICKRFCMDFKCDFNKAYLTRYNI